MASKKVLYSVLGLRVVTLPLLAASVVVLATDNIKFSGGAEFSFTDLLSYRYVVAVAGIGFVYTAIQLPFAIYFAATEKRWINTGCLPEFDFYGDKVVSLLLASGVGLGFGVTADLKRSVKQSSAADEFKSKEFEFLDRAFIAAGILLAGVLTMAITSVITSIKRSENRGFFG